MATNMYWNANSTNASGYLPTTPTVDNYYSLNSNAQSSANNHYRMFGWIDDHSNINSGQSVNRLYNSNIQGNLSD